MLKWLGAGLVIFGSTAIGTAMTTELKRRVGQLQELRTLIVALQGEIRYGNATLNMAFRHVAARIKPPYRQFLEHTAAQMEEFRGEGLAEIFEQNLRRDLQGTALKPEDLELLGRLGESLGYLDVKTQMDSLDLFLEQLGRLCAEAEKEMHSKAKVYHYLGVTGGLFLALILI